MAEEIPITIKTIDDKSPHLETVIELGDANKATLSFFPEGAFRKYAARRQIIVALDPQSGCIGYLLYGYSPTYDRITLIHLCIDPLHRGKKVARKLVNYLIQITQDCSGIGLTCRRDYQLGNMWSRLGFVAQYDEPAKTQGKLNTYWWLDHGHPNLFSTAATHQRKSKLSVVVDADIFLDFYANDNSNPIEDKLLLSDWLQPDLDLCLTDEIFNKINTVSDLTERKHLYNCARRFNRLPCQNQRLDEVFQALQEVFFINTISIHESDTRYLARTIATDSHIFVTRNSSLLDISNEIYKKFQVSIVSPVELINQLEDLRRNPNYQPFRLAGTLLKQTRIQRGNEKFINEHFQAKQHGETKIEFQQKLCQFLTETARFDCSIVLEGENQPLAFVVYDRDKRHELEIPMFRVGDNLLAVTIAHHLVFQAVSLAAREQRQFTRITDLYLQEAVTTAIQQDTFVKVKNGWLRANLAVAEPASNLSQRLINLAAQLGQDYDFCRQIANTLNAVSTDIDIKTMLDIERFLSPAKIIDADIPTFIIPIKPFWAQQLFDAKLAEQTLLGATKTELALNREAVYYKAKNGPKGLKPGVSGRILWYASSDGDGGYKGVSAIRACSRLDEVAIAKPKELYRRFRNLGIYEWKNLLDVALNNIDNAIMAIRFSDTELFNKPIPLKKIQDVLGKKISMQGAYRISKEDFARLYTLGNPYLG